MTSELPLIAQEEEENGIGDVDLFTLVDEGGGLEVNAKWLQHLQERLLGEDGHPRKVCLPHARGCNRKAVFDVDSCIRWGSAPVAPAEHNQLLLLQPFACCWPASALPHLLQPCGMYFHCIGHHQGMLSSSLHASRVGHVLPCAYSHLVRAWQVQDMEDPHRLGLVLEWVYGTIVSTAEKARDGAKRSLGKSAPAVTLYHPCILLASRKLFCAEH